MPAAAPFDPQAIVDAEYTERPVKPGVTTKRTICQSCDIACSEVRKFNPDVELPNKRAAKTVKS